MKWRSLQFLLLFPIMLLYGYVRDQKIYIEGSIAVTLTLVIAIFIVENFIFKEQEKLKKGDLL